jgi:hypothetical protein
MTQEVFDLLKTCAKDKEPGDFVFTWPDGRPVKDVRGSWAKLVKSVGMPDLLLHDLRRTAARIYCGIARNPDHAGIERLELEDVRD